MPSWQVIKTMLTLSLTTGLIGCSLYASDGSQDTGDSANPQPLSFEQQSTWDLPEKVAAKVKELEKLTQETPAHAEVKAAGKTFVLLTPGHRQTGGYSLRINKVEQIGNRIKISAEELSPSQDSFNTQALNTPVTVISLKPNTADPQFDYSIQPVKEKSPAFHSLQYQKESPTDLPQTVHAQTEKLKQQNQVAHSAVPFKDRIYFIVTLGQRPTGGYQVYLDKITQSDSEIHIYVEEIAPSPDMMVTQIITNPIQVVSIPKPKGKKDFIFHISSTPPENGKMKK